MLSDADFPVSASHGRERNSSGPLARCAGRPDSGSGGDSGRMMADAMTLLGRTDDALRWLRTAVQYGFINYPNVSANDAFLAPLRGESAFVALMAELRPRWDAVVR